MAIHSSLVWAWAMSPGPKTTQGMSAAPRGPASMPKGTPRTSGRRPVAEKGLSSREPVGHSSGGVDLLYSRISEEPPPNPRAV